jgi:hypothetical protein
MTAARAWPLQSPVSGSWPSGEGAAVRKNWMILGSLSALTLIGAGTPAIGLDANLRLGGWCFSRVHQFAG